VEITTFKSTLQRLQSVAISAMQFTVFGYKISEIDHFANVLYQNLFYCTHKMLTVAYSVYTTLIEFNLIKLVLGYGIN